MAVIVSVYAAGAVPGEFLPGAQAAFLTSAVFSAAAGRDRRDRVVPAAATGRRTEPRGARTARRRGLTAEAPLSVASDRIPSVDSGRDACARGGIGALQGTALTLGALLGTGVISLPALAAEAAGPASLVAWGVLLPVSVAFAATFTALGSRFPDGGGVTTYVRRAFGHRASTAVGWAFYFTIPLGAPTAAGFAAHYVADALGRAAAPPSSRQR